MRSSSTSPFSLRLSEDGESARLEVSEGDGHGEIDRQRRRNMMHDDDGLYTLASRHLTSSMRPISSRDSLQSLHAPALHFTERSLPEDFNDRGRKRGVTTRSEGFTLLQMKEAAIAELQSRSKYPTSSSIGSGKVSRRSSSPVQQRGIAAHMQRASHETAGRKRTTTSTAVNFVPMGEIHSPSRISLTDSSHSPILRSPLYVSHGSNTTAAAAEGDRTHASLIALPNTSVHFAIEKSRLQDIHIPLSSHLILSSEEQQKQITDFSPNQRAWKPSATAMSSSTTSSISSSPQINWTIDQWREWASTGLGAPASDNQLLQDEKYAETQKRLFPSSVLLSPLRETKDSSVLPKQNLASTQPPLSTESKIEASTAEATSSTAPTAQSAAVSPPRAQQSSRSSATSSSAHSSPFTARSQALYAAAVANSTRSPASPHAHPATISRSRDTSPPAARHSPVSSLRGSPPPSTLQSIAVKAIRNLHHRLLLRQMYDTWQDELRRKRNMATLLQFVQDNYDTNLLRFQFLAWRKALQSRINDRRLHHIESQAVKKAQVKLQKNCFKSWKATKEYGKKQKKKLQLIWKEKGHSLRIKQQQRGIFSHWSALTQHYEHLAAVSEQHFAITTLRTIFYPWYRETAHLEVAFLYSRRSRLKNHFHQWRLAFRRMKDLHAIQKHFSHTARRRTFYAWHQLLETQWYLKSHYYKQWKRLFFLSTRIRQWRAQRVFTHWIRCVNEQREAESKSYEFQEHQFEPRYQQRLKHVFWNKWKDEAEVKFEINFMKQIDEWRRNKQRERALASWRQFHSRSQHNKALNAAADRHHYIKIWRGYVTRQRKAREMHHQAVLFNARNRSHAYIIRWLIWKNDSLLLKTRTNLLHLFQLRPFVRTLRLFAQYKNYLKRMRLVARGYNVRRLGGVHFNEWASRAESYRVGREQNMPDAFWKSSAFRISHPHPYAALMRYEPGQNLHERPDIQIDLPQNSFQSSSYNGGMTAATVTSPVRVPRSINMPRPPPAPLSTNDLEASLLASAANSSAVHITDSMSASEYPYEPSKFTVGPVTSASTTFAASASTTFKPSSSIGQNAPIDHSREISAFPGSEFVQLPTKASTQIILDAIKGLPQHKLPYPEEERVPRSYLVSEAKRTVEEMQFNLGGLRTKFHMPLPVEPLQPSLTHFTQPSMIASSPFAATIPLHSYGTSSSSTASFSVSSSIAPPAATVASSTIAAIEASGLTHPSTSSLSMPLASHSLDPITQRKSNRQKLELMLRVNQEPAEKFYRDKEEQDRVAAALAARAAARQLRASDGGNDEDLSNYRNEELSRLHYNMNVQRKFLLAWFEERKYSKRTAHLVQRVNERVLHDYFILWYNAEIHSMKATYISTNRSIHLGRAIFESWLNFTEERRRAREEKGEILRDYVERRTTQLHFQEWYLLQLEQLNARKLAEKELADRKICLLGLLQEFSKERRLRLLAVYLPYWFERMQLVRGERRREERLEAQCRAFLYEKHFDTLIAQHCFPLWRAKTQKKLEMKAFLKQILVDEAWKQTKQYKLVKLGRSITSVSDKMALYRAFYQRWLFPIRRESLREVMHKAATNFHRREVLHKWSAMNQARIAQAKWDEDFATFTEKVHSRIQSAYFDRWATQSQQLFRMKLHMMLLEKFQDNKRENQMEHIFTAWKVSALTQRKEREMEEEKQRELNEKNRLYLSLQVSNLCYKFALLRKSFRWWMSQLEQRRRSRETVLPVVPVFKDENGLILQTEILHPTPTKTEQPLPFGVIYQPYVVTETVVADRSPMKLMGSSIEAVSPPPRLLNLVAPPEETPEQKRARRAARQARVEQGLEIGSTASSAANSPLQPQQVSPPPSPPQVLSREKQEEMELMRNSINLSPPLHIDDLARSHASPARSPVRTPPQFSPHRSTTNASSMMSASLPPTPVAPTPTTPSSLHASQLSSQLSSSSGATTSSTSSPTRMRLSGRFVENRIAALEEMIASQEQQRKLHKSPLKQSPSKPVSISASVAIDPSATAPVPFKLQEIQSQQQNQQQERELSSSEFAQPSADRQPSPRRVHFEPSPQLHESMPILPSTSTFSTAPPSSTSSRSVHIEEELQHSSETTMNESLPDQPAVTLSHSMDARELAAEQPSLTFDAANATLHSTAPSVPQFVGFALPFNEPTDNYSQQRKHRSTSSSPTRSSASTAAVVSSSPVHAIASDHLHVPLRSVLSSGVEARLEKMDRPMVPRSRFASSASVVPVISTSDVDPQSVGRNIPRPPKRFHVNPDLESGDFANSYERIHAQRNAMVQSNAKRTAMGSIMKPQAQRDQQSMSDWPMPSSHRKENIVPLSASVRASTSKARAEDSMLAKAFEKESSKSLSVLSKSATQERNPPARTRPTKY